MRPLRSGLCIHPLQGGPCGAGQRGVRYRGTAHPCHEHHRALARFDVLRNDHRGAAVYVQRRYVLLGRRARHAQLPGVGFARVPQEPPAAKKSPYRGAPSRPRPLLSQERAGHHQLGEREPEGGGVRPVHGRADTDFGGVKKLFLGLIIFFQ